MWWEKKRREWNETSCAVVWRGNKLKRFSFHCQHMHELFLFDTDDDDHFWMKSKMNYVEKGVRIEMKRFRSELVEIEREKMWRWRKGSKEMSEIFLTKVIYVSRLCCRSDQTNISTYKHRGSLRVPYSIWFLNKNQNRFYFRL